MAIGYALGCLWFYQLPHTFWEPATLLDDEEEDEVVDLRDSLAGGPSTTAGGVASGVEAATAAAALCVCIGMVRGALAALQDPWAPRQGPVTLSKAGDWAGPRVVVVVV